MKRILAMVVVAALAMAIPALACGENGECPFGKMTGVEKSVTKLDNGIKIVWSAKDAAVVQKLQNTVSTECKDCCVDCLKDANVAKSIEKTSDGIAVTFTSSNKDAVAKLVAFGDSQKGDCKGKCPMAKKTGART